MPHEQVLVVEPSQRGVHLADLLEQGLPPAHRVDLRALIAAGAVAVNGEVVTASRRLRLGDVVQVRLGALASRPVASTPLPEVLAETATALVVHKPAGSLVVPDRHGLDPGLHGLLEQLRPGADLRVVHRLDRDTSGCLLLAKGLAAARHFDACFQDGRVHKLYLALVAGRPTTNPFRCEGWLGPDPRRPGKVVVADRERPGFRAALTEGAIRRVFAAHSLLELRLLTGRTHQLRVHLAHLGLPIVGDLDYGGERLLLSSLKRGYKQRVGVAERPLLDRMFLHAERLSFPDLDGAVVEVVAPLPEPLVLVLEKLERFDAGRR